MPLYLREIVANKRSFFIWSAVLIAFNIIVFSFYRSFIRRLVDLQKLLENYPEVLVKLMGGDRLDLTNILHFYAAEICLFVALVGSIYAMILGTGIISKEEDYKTIEFLLAQPLSREKIITSKGLSVLSYIIFYNILLFLSNYIMLEILKTEEYSLKLFFLLSLGIFLLHLTFASIGFFISVFVKRARASMSISLGVVFGTYSLSVASALSEKLEVVKYLSPFKYMEAADIIINGRIDIINIIIIATIILFTVGGTYIFFHKKDIYS